MPSSLKPHQTDAVKIVAPTAHVTWRQNCRRKAATKSRHKWPPQMAARTAHASIIAPHDSRRKPRAQNHGHSAGIPREGRRRSSGKKGITDPANKPHDKRRSECHAGLSNRQNSDADTRYRHQIPGPDAAPGKPTINDQQSTAKATATSCQFLALAILSNARQNTRPTLFRCVCSDPPGCAVHSSSWT